jgi:hypothetical protein
MKETPLLRKVLLSSLVALVVVVPAQANAGKKLAVRGLVVRASAELVTVENFQEDAMLTCRVPERLARKASSLKQGDRVRMLCVRHRGRRAELVGIERLGDKAEARALSAKGVVSERSDASLTVLGGDQALTCTVPDRLAERVAKVAVGDKVAIVCKQVGGGLPELAAVETYGADSVELRAQGAIAELGASGIVVVDKESGKRLACRVPAEKSYKLAGLAVGELVKIVCQRRGDVAELSYLERVTATVAAEVRLAGRVSALSPSSVTVQGEEHSLTCTVPASFAEKLARLAVGDRVKMLCRGSELTYIEKLVA